MKLSILLLIAVSLWAEDKPPANPELDAANARIADLEEALDKMATKSQACFEMYGADMRLSVLLPKIQQAKAQAVTQAPAQAAAQAAAQYKALPPAKAGPSQAAPK